MFHAGQPMTSGVSCGADARRLALEIIATLVNVKKTAAERLLRCAGVQDDLIRRFLTERDPVTGQKRSKREAGSVVLDALGPDGQEGRVVRELISIAARWDAFHLAADEYKARAVVQKARELAGTLAAADARERAAHEERAREQREHARKEKQEALRTQSELLLAQFDQAQMADNPQMRGYFVEDLLNRLFDLHQFPVTRAFRRNGGAEQIDGAFELNGWQYLVECRWRAKLADIGELDGLIGKVCRSSRQTMGLFLSINGWSDHVPTLLKQNPDKCLILMNGSDLRSVLTLEADLRTLLMAKAGALALDAEPYLPASGCRRTVA
jgi:hypothetical protein